jgi:hypothetical protein
MHSTRVAPWALMFKEVSGFRIVLFGTFKMVGDRACLWFAISLHARALMFSSMLFLTLIGNAFSRDAGRGLFAGSSRIPRRIVKPLSDLSVQSGSFPGSLCNGAHNPSNPPGQAARRRSDRKQEAVGLNQKYPRGMSETKQKERLRRNLFVWRAEFPLHV